MDYITIASAGNAKDFGNMSTRKAATAGVDIRNRTVFGGGFTVVTKHNVIEYVTIASTGNVTDFGDLTVARTPGHGGMSNQTRGVFSAGNSSTVITLDYITIASTGDATDFGDLTMIYASYGGGKGNGHGGIDRSTAFASLPAAIGFHFGGRTAFPGNSVITFINIASTSDTTQFGDLTTPRSEGSAIGSSSRALHFGGYTTSSSNISNIIESVEYSTKGTASDFGDTSGTSRA